MAHIVCLVHHSPFNFWTSLVLEVFGYHVTKLAKINLLFRWMEVGVGSPVTYSYIPVHPYLSAFMKMHGNKVDFSL